MSAARMRGLFPILVTPFDEQDRIDEESLRRLVEYNIEGGVHGFGLAGATEFAKLTEDERAQVTRIVIDQTGKRVPVIATTGAPSTHAAVLYSRQLEDLGADGVISVPPAGVPASETRAYFKAISDAVHVPVWIQDAAVPISGELMRQIAGESERVRYAKVEGAPAVERVEEWVKQGAGLVTVFGGASGLHLIAELRLGTQGTMPWPDLPRPFRQVWDLWQQGEEVAAARVWEERIAPLLRVPAPIHKEVLRRLGIIRCVHFRAPSPEPPDAQALRQLDQAMEQIGLG
ncbi:MAG: dihydrodipicolinate synthase family protein [Candidatus Handelsmanbacteria bacterium]|nr:dihydrodipicolinate synthase family protein [Candidatus Handelsmanbacteria bacterium]